MQSVPQLDCELIQVIFYGTRVSHGSLIQSHALGCRAKFTYFLCSTGTAISHFPLLCLCLFSIIIVASSIIFLLATQLLVVVGNVHVWKVFFSSRLDSMAE